MVEPPATDAPRGRHVISVQAWRGRFADGSPDGLDAVVVEFGAEDGDVPPLILPASAVSQVARVLFEAARSETRPVTGPARSSGAGGSVPRSEGPLEAAAGPGPGAPSGPAASAPGGEAWARLLGRPPVPAVALAGTDIPASPGVYAWLRNGRPVYLGRAKSKRGLRSRLGSDQRVGEAELGRAGFRRFVATHLGVAPSAHRLGADDLARVNEWIAGCEVVWLACTGSSQAAALEEALRREWDPVAADA